MNNVSAFVKYHRAKLDLTQEQLADKAGVGLRFMRELENGKETQRMDKVNQVLALFGFSLTPNKNHLDAYEIWNKYIGLYVEITLTDKKVKLGVLIKEVIDLNENKITAWKFVKNSQYLQFHKNKNKNGKFIEVIQHNSIQHIGPQ